MVCIQRERRQPHLVRELSFTSPQGEASNREILRPTFLKTQIPTATIN